MNTQQRVDDREGTARGMVGASFVLGILGLMGIPIVWIIGIICGVGAYSEADPKGSTRGLAIIAVVINVACIFLQLSN